MTQQSEVENYIEFFDYIRELRPDWHMNYIYQIVDRYMTYRNVPLADAKRAIKAGYTHPADAVLNGVLDKKYREHLST